MDGFTKCFGMVNYMVKPYRCLEHHDLLENNPLVFLSVKGNIFLYSCFFFFFFFQITKVRNGFALNLHTVFSFMQSALCYIKKCGMN